MLYPFGRLPQIFTCSLSLAFFSPASAIAGDYSLDANALYDSRYVSEGRDNLAQGGAYVLEASVARDDFTLVAAYLDATSDTYSEINLGLEYGFELDDLEAYVAYTRLEFPETDDSDNEFAFGIAHPGFDGFTPALDYVYSTEANGAFVELSVASEHEVSNDLTLAPYIVQAIDLGYASAAHDGLNNLTLGVEASYEVNRDFQVVAYLAHSIAQKDVENDGLGDVSWGGVSINLPF